MLPSRRRTVEAFGGLTEGELSVLIEMAIKAPLGTVADEIVSTIGEMDTFREDDDCFEYSTRGLTGVMAEEAFIRYHAATQKPEPGRLVDVRYEGCGYDFKLITESYEIAIEVKGVTGESGGVTFTDKEWTTAGRIGDSYYLVVVRNVTTEPEVSLVRNPLAVLEAKLRTYTVFQVEWSVSHKALCQIK